jgi:Zn-dependent M16 (insulinase) family peptidase
VIEKLKIIQQFALSDSSSLRVALTCAASSSDKNEAALKQFLSQLPSNVSIPPPSTPTKDLQRNSKTFFPLPYQVYYSAFAMPTVPYTNPSGAPLQILSQMLTNKHLHHEIREKGGAYGGGASASGLGGLFSFYSYRDPNPQNTMRIVENAGKWAMQRNWTDRDLEEAKLSVFQSVDAPQSVSDEGMTRFLTGVTEEMQQVRREQLLDVKVDDVKRVAEEFLVNEMSKGRVAVLGEKKDWVNDEWAVKDMGMQEALKSVVGEDGEQLQQAVGS